MRSHLGEIKGAANEALNGRPTLECEQRRATKSSNGKLGGKEGSVLCFMSSRAIGENSCART